MPENKNGITDPVLDMPMMEQLVEQLCHQRRDRENELIDEVARLTAKVERLEKENEELRSRIELLVPRAY